MNFALAETFYESLFIHESVYFKRSSKTAKTMGSRLSFLFAATSIHGLKHLTNENEGWKKNFKRIFCTIFLGLSFLVMLRMLRNMFHKQSTSTAINLDTAYRDFDNVFPAISICLTKGRSTAEIKNLIGSEFVKPDGEKMKLAMRHYRAIQGYLFMNYIEPLEGINIEHCSDLNDTCGIDFQIVRNALAPDTCRGVIDKMFFLGKPVHCEDFFDRFDTEIGVCFVANSLYSKGIKNETNLEDFKGLKMRYSNNENVERSLEIHYKDNQLYLYKLLIHSPEELPDGRLQNIGLRKIGGMMYIAIKTAEFHNQPDVKYESIDARKCRFPFERFDTFNLPYSLNYCKYLKRVSMELDTCNCTLPVLLGKHDLKICVVKEFECADTLAKKMKEDMKNRVKLMEMIGDCLIPTCISMEIS